MTEFEQTINRLMKEAVVQLQAINIYPSENILSIKENKRARKRLGCCKRIYKNGVSFFELEISAMLQGAGEELIKEVIIHELLHTCPDCLNHGLQWKKYAEKVNREYGYHIQRTAKEDYGIGESDSHPLADYKYKITCTQCGAVSYRMKKSKVVNNIKKYRCAECGGYLEVKKLK